MYNHCVEAYYYAIRVCYFLLLASPAQTDKVCEQPTKWVEIACACLLTLALMQAPPARHKESQPTQDWKIAK